MITERFIKFSLLLQLAPPSVSIGPAIFDMGQVETRSFMIYSPFLKEFLVNLANYF